MVNNESESVGGECVVVTSGDQMPVCLHGDLLQFMAAATMIHYDGGPLRLREREEAGDTYDGASIPRWAWSIIGHPLEQRFRWPSYWHDRLCESSRTWADRRLADAVLLVLLEEAGVGYWRRTAMWLAVRTYAWFVWKGPMAC